MHQLSFTLVRHGEIALARHARMNGFTQLIKQLIFIDVTNAHTMKSWAIHKRNTHSNKIEDAS